MQNLATWLCMALLATAQRHRFNNRYGIVSKLEDDTQLDRGDCNDTPRPIRNARITVFSYRPEHHAMAKCIPHHRTAINTTSMAMTCVRDKWHIHNFPEGVSVSCRPWCDPSCRQGVCKVAANGQGTYCKCFPLYTGRTCASLGCRTLPQVTRAVVRWVRPNYRTHAVCETEACGQKAEGTCWRGGFFNVPGLDAALLGAPRPSVASFLCVNGQWRFEVPNRNVLLPFNVARCEYECQPPCQNGGICTLTHHGHRKCQCAKGFAGPQCQYRKCDDLILPGGRLSSGGSLGYAAFVRKACPTGYIHTSTGNNTYIERCVDGIWVSPQGLCVPLCAPACQNGGTCVSPNFCVCPPGFSGALCERLSCINAVTPTITHAVYVNEGHSLTIECQPGFRFPSGEPSMTFDCLSGQWDFETKPPQPCLPDCSEAPCLHGGTCTAPNKCMCTTHFTGDQCEHEMCINPPKLVCNAVGNFSSASYLDYRIACEPGHRLLNGKTYARASCRDGAWDFEPAFQPAMRMRCRPVCSPPCVNGGRCVDQDTCHCPEGFVGSHCERRYELTVESHVYCQFPFRYQNKWYFACTTVDYKLPWCATKTHADGTFAAWSVCVADFGKVRVTATYGGGLCQFPFLQGNHVFSACTTLGQKQPWCATALHPNGTAKTTDLCHGVTYGSRTVMLTVGGQECKSFSLYQLARKLVRGPTTTIPCSASALYQQQVMMDGAALGGSGGNVVLIDSGYSRTEVTQKGDTCQFPFVLSGHKYFDCVQVGHRPPWCATKVSPDGGILAWDTCVNVFYSGRGIQELTLATVYPQALRHHSLFALSSTRLLVSMSGRRCLFPFVYQGKAYHRCVYQDSLVPWCATSLTEEGEAATKGFCPFDWDPVYFRYSILSFVSVHLDFPMTEVGLSCVPFVHRGQLTRGCVQEAGQLPWCAVHVTHDLRPAATDFCLNFAPSYNTFLADEQLREYVIMLMNISNYQIFTPDFGEGEFLLYTVDGARCLPFLHEGKMHRGCVEEEPAGGGRPGASGGASGGPLPWCAVAVDEASRPTQKGRCPRDWRYWAFFLNPTTRAWSPLARPVGKIVTDAGEQCVLPFTYRGKQYNRCVQADGEPPWCSVQNDDYGGVVRMGYCKLDAGTTHQPYTKGGMACVPFLFGGELHEGCLRTPEAPLPWCATKVNNQGLVTQWDYCDVTEEQSPVDSRESPVEAEQPPYETSESPAPTEVPPLCVPFRFGEEIVSGCVGEEGGEQTIEMEEEGEVIVSGRWCASEVDENMNVLSIIPCPAMPNVTGDQPPVDSRESPVETEQPPSVTTSAGNFTEEPIENKESRSGPLEIPTETSILETSACVPFRYGEEIVSGCVGEEGKEEIIETMGEIGTDRWKVRGRWCASEVDGDMNIVSVMRCPETQDCVPFLYGEEIVSGCVGEEGKEEIIEMEGEEGMMTKWKVEGRWCASEVDENLNALSIIGCPTESYDTGCVPFLYGEEIVGGCVGEEGKEEIFETEGEGGVINRWTVEGRWCASEVDGDMRIVSVISCPTMPNVTEQPPPVTASESFQADQLSGTPEPRSPSFEAEGPPHVTYGETSVYAVTVDGKICVFPFTWAGVSYSNCTTADRRIPWCATQLNDRREPVSSGYCKDTLVGPVPSEPPPFVPDERATNTSQCKFPFVYKGMTYFTCTREDSLIPWCALDVDRNRRPTRVGCCHGQDGFPFPPLQPEGPGGISPTQLTAGGEQCIFPFQHGGEWHYSCVPSRAGQGRGRSWCVTRVDAFAQPVAADYCVEPSTQAPVSLTDAHSERRTTDGLACVFPFWHQGRWFKDCTSADSEEDPWCATEVDVHGAVLKAGICRRDTAATEEKCGDADVATETASGVACVFPFVYRGRRYCRCTSADERAPWCATRVDERRRVIAGDYCAENRTHEDVDVVGEPAHTVDGSKCVFPFYYKGNRYSKCHPVERARPWCPVMVNARMEPLQSGYCEGDFDVSVRFDGTSALPFQPPPVVLGLTMTLSLGPCVFPFSYKGEVHERCSCKDAPACWCPTSLNDNREPAVTDYCKSLLEGSVPEVSPPAFGADAATTVDGVPCVFPFRLGDVTYTRCTEAYRGAPWCATQVDAALRPVRSGFCKGVGEASAESPVVLPEDN